MKCFLVQVMLIMIFNTALCQVSGRANLRIEPADTITFRFSDEEYYKAVRRLIRKSFSSIATGQGEAANYSTYGAFEPLNGTYKFNIYGMGGSYKKPWLYNVSLKGEVIGDNSGVLFNNSKFSTGSTLSGKIHLPLAGAHTYNDSDFAHVNYRLDSLKNNYDARLALMRYKLSSNYDSLVYRSTVIKLGDARKELQTLSYTLDTCEEKLNQISPKDSFKSRFYLETILKLTSALEAKIRAIYDLKTDSANQKTALLEPGINTRKFGKDSTLLKEQFNKKTDSLFMNLGPVSQSIPWIAISGNYNRSKYYIFNGALPFSMQLDEQKYNNFDFGVELNWFISNSFYSKIFKNRIIILNVGVKRLEANDADDYSTSEVSKTAKYTLADSTNTLTKKYNVFTNSISSYKAWKIYGSTYYFVGKENRAAIHLFPEVEFRNNHTNPFSMGLGFVFTVRGKKDNSIFNVEVYSKFKDIGKSLPSKEDSFVDRNEIGVNFAVPINRPSLK